jgi:hypothetical protein
MHNYSLASHTLLYIAHTYMDTDEPVPSSQVDTRARSKKDIVPQGCNTWNRREMCLLLAVVSPVWHGSTGKRAWRLAHRPGTHING